MRGLYLVAASGGHSSSRCAGLSLSRPLWLRSTGSRRSGSAIVAHGPSCFAACGIFPDQGSNPCPLHWQADSQPLHHQGSPPVYLFEFIFHFPSLILIPSAQMNSTSFCQYLPWVFLLVLSFHFSQTKILFLPFHLFKFNSLQ